MAAMPRFCACAVCGDHQRYPGHETSPFCSRTCAASFKASVGTCGKSGKYCACDTCGDRRRYPGHETSPFCSRTCAASFKASVGTCDKSGKYCACDTCGDRRRYPGHETSPFCSRSCAASFKATKAAKATKTASARCALPGCTNAPYGAFAYCGRSHGREHAMLLRMGEAVEIGRPCKTCGSTLWYVDRPAGAYCSFECAKK
jgi:hypothetical protein